MSSGEQTANEIFASVAKNNINQLNELNDGVEKETKKVGQKVPETAKETIALSTFPLCWQQFLLLLCLKHFNITLVEV